MKEKQFPDDMIYTPRKQGLWRRKEKVFILIKYCFTNSKAISSSIKGSNDTLNFKSNYNRSLLSERYLRETQ